MTTPSPAPQRLGATEPPYPFWAWTCSRNPEVAEDKGRWHRLTGPLPRARSWPFYYWLPDQPEKPTCDPRTTPSPAPQQLAELFHEIYERLAPSFGYETRKETRAFDPTTPNGRLMIAVCGEIITRHAAAISEENAKLKAERENWRMSSVCRELSEENERLKAQLALQNAPHDHDHLPSHAQLMEENERLKREVEEARKKQPLNTHRRLFDLVRYMRAELHRDNLVSDEEYSWLCSHEFPEDKGKPGSPSPRRLEDYDDLRAQLTALRQWSEQAREAMRAHIADLGRMAVVFDSHGMSKTASETRLAATELAALLQSHPAATNLTEEGKVGPSDTELIDWLEKDGRDVLCMKPLSDDKDQRSVYWVRGELDGKPRTFREAVISAMKSQPIAP